MILILRQDASNQEVESLERMLQERGTQTRAIRGEERSVIAVIGTIKFDEREFRTHPAVLEVLRVSKPYKLASRESGICPRVKLGASVLGGPQFIVMAGPCAVESREMLLSTARRLAALGVTVLRGGAFKPRTSPYAFQGMGEEGLKILAEAREETGMKVVTEVMTADKVDLVAKYADLLQIGARNMQNFDLLRAVAETDKPVILKRGLSATIDEWLMSAEYILGKNPRVILCERGIRTFETRTRNTLDLNAVPVLKDLSHLPVIVDPSHGTGVRGYVLPMSLAAMGAGADGLLIEVHPDPEHALSDGPQSLTIDQLERLLKALQTMAPVVGRELELSSKRPASATDDRTARVVYQGEPGAFSEKAAMAYFGDVQPAGIPTFRGVFEKVGSGEAEYGVVPIENSLMGPIHQNTDLLLEHDLSIVGELKLKVSHCLIANRGATKSGIRRLYVHPAAAAQCDRYLREHASSWTVTQSYDTAGSVKMIRDEKILDGAAVASAEAAAVYGMEILAEGIEDHPQNYTRFVVISRTPRVDARCNKTSLAYATHNEPGALHATLRAFADRGVNLTRLESRPIPGRPWEYMFLVDLEGNVESPGLKEAIAEIAPRTTRLRVLGCYVSA
jgi:3-deoxy-7-phosphoheptulonate synthase